VFQCQNGIIPRSNRFRLKCLTLRPSSRFNARTALSLVRTSPTSGMSWFASRFNARTALSLVRTYEECNPRHFKLQVSMPERHYPSFELPASDPPDNPLPSFQCQNGIIPRSNIQAQCLLAAHRVRFNARTALSLVRTSDEGDRNELETLGVSMPERHYPSFERNSTSSRTFVMKEVFQCQNGIIPRSNGLTKPGGLIDRVKFQCQNGIMPRSNTPMSPTLSLPQCLVSMPERHYPSFEPIGGIDGKVSLLRVSMPERHYPAFERGLPAQSCLRAFQCQNGIILRSNTWTIQLKKWLVQNVSMPERHYP